MINDILDLSRIESGRLEMESVDFELRTLLDDIASMLALTAAKKGIEFICAADPDVPGRFTGEPGLLRQVITNLAGNAIKFTPKGEVELRVSVTRGANPADSAAGSGAGPVTLLFTVRDTGIGIPEDRLDRLFEDYAQADASISRRYGGTGLGLAISKRLVDLMDGEIGVQSVQGKGSTFWFTVRLGRPEPAEAPRPDPAALKGLRVLVVDDNITNREILLARLSAWGMLPDEAEDGISALDMITRAAQTGNPYRLAVVDHEMPVMDGETLGRAINADARFRDTRTVLMTSLAQRGDLGRFREAGFAACLCKPVLHGELQTCLNQAVREDAGTAPIARRPDREAAPAGNSDFSGRGARILLVEDNTTNQLVAQGILANMGLAADAVDNGRKALEALSRAPYDLVLMDVQMPVMDGYECTRSIRDPGTSVLNHDVPIIAMTAHAQAGDRERCMAAGMNDHVPKPISVPALAAALQAWLPAGRSVHAPAGGQPVAEEQQSPVWDKAAFMGRIMDDEDLARDIVRGFRADAEGRLETMRRALAGENLQVLASQSHCIKGAAANLGARRLLEAARSLEDTAKAGSVQDCGEGLSGLGAALAEFLAEAARIGQG